MGSAREGSNPFLVDLFLFSIVWLTKTKQNVSLIKKFVFEASAAQSFIEIIQPRSQPLQLNFFYHFEKKKNLLKISLESSWLGLLSIIEKLTSLWLTINGYNYSLIGCIGWRHTYKKIALFKVELKIFAYITI
jgi:hypothetical protein